MPGSNGSPQFDVLKTEKKEDSLKERPSRKNKKKEKDVVVVKEKSSVKSKTEKRPLVLPAEVSFFALFLTVLLGAFYVVSILSSIYLYTLRICFCYSLN